MNTLARLAWSLLCLSALPTMVFADPASLEVPANQTLALTLTAKGVQIYECRAVTGDPAKFEWAFKAPEADLFDAQDHKVGRHYAGPTWELADGNRVVGKLKAKANAPDGKGVPWLLLDAAQASGAILGKVQSIQRVDTVGGKAPSESADAAKAGQEKRVDYTATYKFYVKKALNELGGSIYHGDEIVTQWRASAVAHIYSHHLWWYRLWLGSTSRLHFFRRSSVAMETIFWRGSCPLFGR